MILPDKETDLEPRYENPSETQDRLIADVDFGRVMKAMESLPLEYREALILKYRNDMSTRELSDVLGISPSGVKMRIKRALVKLRALLGDMADG